ncbi:MAG TPA: hypothetical protein VNG95_02540 [Gemmatimonadales bacterium]|nr:hypothetical protein [Gemmatimonadales bacterium]
MRARIATFALLLGAARLGAQSAPAAVHAGVTYDTRHHRVTVVIGPYDVAPTGGSMEMPGMDMSMDDMGAMAQTFVWPEQGWFYGFHTELIDAGNKPMPRWLMHHFTLLNFDRRTLFDPYVERLASARYNGEDVVAPKTIGAPLTAGTRLGLYMMWFNDKPDTVRGVFVRLTLYYMPSNMQPAPISALPVVMDVALIPGQAEMYDVPPGDHERSRIFRFPISGHLVGAGGHLHEQGAYVRLEDSVTGKVLVDLRPVLNAQGEMTGLTRRILALNGPGLRILANHPYRLVAAYHNTSRDTLHEAMGEMMGIFSPDDFAQWPAVDYADRAFLTDLATYGIRAIPDSLTAAAAAMRAKAVRSR